MITGSDFAKTYGPQGIYKWEAAAVAEVTKDSLTPWPWMDLHLADELGNAAVLRVQTDMLAIGPTQDHLRLPLFPSTAQGIFNLFGWLLPTPRLVYRIYQAAARKLQPVAMVPNLFHNMEQWVRHNAAVDAQLAAIAAQPGAPTTSFISGIGKNVVVSNIYKEGFVLIQGWYRPPPSPDVFDDRRPLDTPDRQPIQPNSNAHVASYIDYSHMIQAIGPEARVTPVGEAPRRMNTVDLYQSPTLWRLVSHEGPVKVPRYPSVVVPRRNLPSQALPPPGDSVDLVTSYPSTTDQGLQAASRFR